MRSQLHRVLVSTAIAAATLLGTASSSFAQVRVIQRDRHEPGPREAPPPPREERHDFRRGFVWVAGHWDWQRREHKWEWTAGRWERERRGQRWRDPRWEQRGDEWVLIDGQWTIGDVRPTQAPPPPREERNEARPGFVWIRGRWDWQNGNWQWQPGRWERERQAQRWNEGRWELRGDHWEWVEGTWGVIPPYPPLDQPPPAPQREDSRVDPGFAWIPGHWAWENGQYAWKPGQRVQGQPGMHYQAGVWIQRNNQWMWTNGGWIKDGPQSGPTAAPPPPRDERHEGRREGHVWVRGRYDWHGGQYEWQPGRWERQRERQTWYDGRWEQRGNVWVWVEGGWR